MTRKLDWNVYIDTAAKTVAEGIVMLKNEHHALPDRKNTRLNSSHPNPSRMPSSA